MKETGACPTIEALAAVADGRAAHEQRDEVLRHVKQCEDCYEILVDTVKLTGSESAQPALESIPRVGPRWHRYAGLALAAAILLAVVIPMSAPILWPPRPASSSEAVARALEIGHEPERLVTGLVQNLDAGLGFSPNLDSGRMAFRFGVRALDLRVARAADDAVWLERILRELGRTLEPVGEHARALRLVQQDRQKLDSGSLTIDDIATLESALAEVDPERFQFGNWAEGGRLAAASQRMALFQSQAFSQGLDLASRLNTTRAVTSEIERIRDLTKADALSREQWDALERSFFDVIQLML